MVVNIRFICLASLLLASGSALAVQAPPEAPAPDVTLFGEGVEHLESFHGALDGLTTAAPGEHVRIAWWGDSAIVGDGYTGEIRRILQERFGDGGPGFTLVAPDFSGYLRKGVRLKRHNWEVASVLKGGRKDGRYGYGGVVGTSYGGAGSTFITPEPRIDRVLVYHRATKRTGALQLFIDDGPLPFAQLDKTRGEVGDRVWTTALETPAQSVRVRAGAGGQSMVYGVALERRDPGVVLDALGLVGLRARRWRKADEKHLADQVATRGVHLVVLAFGGNERVDANLSVERHSAVIVETVRRFRASSPEASCLVVGPIAHAKKRSTRLDPRLETIYAAQEEAAEAEGCAFFDTVAAMGGDEAVRRFKSKRLLGRDMAHLTSRGHVVVGGLIGNWLLAGYEGR